jgi:ABC-type Mn2+/Zn2+ transport system permease subunit
MTEDKQQRIKALEGKIKASKSWYSFCGTLGAFAILSVFLSILLGNRTLGLCAVSWIAGSFFAFAAEAAKSRRNELEDEICAIKLSSQLEASLNNAARQSVQTVFGPIGMN